jgi:hypothetical protein
VIATTAEPIREAPMDTSELEAAYQPVLELATRAAGPGQGPGPPDDGGQEWGPDDVLAHLIINDRLLARAVRSVLAGTAEPYDNLDAIGLAELRALAGDIGDTAALIGELESSSRELVSLAGRLDQAQAASPVPVRILDGDQLVVDNPLPVKSLLAIQARRHLPMHEAQLSELLGQS